MTSPFEQRLENELARRREEGLWRELRVCPPCRVNLSSNDYLQLRRHPKVQEGARRAVEEFGAGSGASPLLSGFLPCHDRLLKQLLKWKQKPFGLLFNSGFMANQAVMKHLPGPRDLVLADRLVHHSIIQALMQGRAKFKRYNHLDLSQLEELLAANRKDYETLFVVTESVFSMDGDYPDLRRLADMKSRIPFVWILDEAHGTGVFGPSGGGLAEETGVLPQVDIVVGTLGKALASMGAYVLTSSAKVVDYLVNYAGEFIYSTFLSPGAAGAAAAAVDLLRNASGERGCLRLAARRFRQRLTGSGWATNAFDSQILPVIIGDIGKTLSLKNTLLERGFLVGAVRPPTVPAGTSRLRISLHSGVTDEHFDELLAVLNRWKNR